MRAAVGSVALELWYGARNLGHDLRQGDICPAAFGLANVGASDAPLDHNCTWGLSHDGERYHWTGVRCLAIPPKIQNNNLTRRGRALLRHISRASYLKRVAPPMADAQPQRPSFAIHTMALEPHGLVKCHVAVQLLHQAAQYHDAGSPASRATTVFTAVNGSSPPCTSLSNNVGIPVILLRLSDACPVEKSTLV